MSNRLANLRRSVMASLKLRILMDAIAALLLGIAVFALSSALGTHLLARYLEPLWAQKQLDRNLQAYQDYVAELGLASSALDYLSQWEGDGTLFVSSVAERAVAFGHRRGAPEREAGGRGQAAATRRMADIRYADGVRPTLFLYVPSAGGRLGCVVLSLLLGFAAFSALFYHLLRRKLRYIGEVARGIHIMESGDLTYSVPIHGEDELGRLAQSLNDMCGALARSFEESRQAARAGREIIADLSHDIRTPLTILSGYVPLLLHGEPLTDTQRRYLELIERKTDQISGRIDELLGYSMLAAGKLPLAPERMPARDIAGRLAKELLPLKPDFEDRTGDGVVLMDPGQLTRLMDNLSANLHRHADLSLPIRLSAREESGRLTLRLTNAPGGQIEGRSNGLGLAICEAILAAHGGGMMAGIAKNSGQARLFETELWLPLV